MSRLERIFESLGDIAAYGTVKAFAETLGHSEPVSLREEILEEEQETDERLTDLASKSGCTSIRRPPGSTTASPQLDSCCAGDFLAANSTFTNRPPAEVTALRLLFEQRFFRWRSSVLKLKPRLSQNSLRRTPLLTNSATNC